MIVSGVDIGPILALDADSRLFVIWELQKSIDADNEAFELTEEQMAELRRRMAEHEADPSSAIPWEVVKADLLKRTRAKRGQ